MSIPLTYRPTVTFHLILYNIYNNLIISNRHNNTPKSPSLSQPIAQYRFPTTPPTISRPSSPVAARRDAPSLSPGPGRFPRLSPSPL